MSWHDDLEGSAFLRELAENLKSDLHIEPDEYDKLRKVADELEQAQIQRRSAEVINCRLQAEREKLIYRVDAALRGIESVK